MSEPFAGIIGHQAVLHILGKALEQPHHAYIIVGEPGLGACLIAESFVRALAGASAEQPLGGHPDIAVLSRGEDVGSTSIPIEAVRELRERVSRRPVVAPRVVAYLPEADRLQETGSNALLKSLEEPPAHAVFVLVVSDLSRLPATIRSRAVVLTLGLVPSPVINDWLKERGWKGEGERNAAVEYALGRPGDALRWLEDADTRVRAAEHVRTVDTLMSAAHPGDAIATLDAETRRAEAADDPQAAWRSLLDGLMHALRPQLAQANPRALMLGQALVAARRRVGGPVSPRVWLELELVRGFANGPTFPQMVTHLVY